MRIVYARLFVSAVAFAVLLALGASVPVDPMRGAMTHVARVASP
ncbi:MAG TPA: hypothetical protein VHE32_04910 [Rhodanobacteraceae bacterium]|jgi:hypothetical protein|nr:hypothetical protein [Rhodanobacteraceae bacterium]